MKMCAGNFCSGCRWHRLNICARYGIEGCSKSSYTWASLSMPDPRRYGQLSELTGPMPNSCKQTSNSSTLGLGALRPFLVLCLRGLIGFPSYSAAMGSSRGQSNGLESSRYARTRLLPHCLGCIGPCFWLVAVLALMRPLLPTVSSLRSVYPACVPSREGCHGLGMQQESTAIDPTPFSALSPPLAMHAGAASPPPVGYTGTSLPVLSAFAFGVASPLPRL